MNLLYPLSIVLARVFSPVFEEILSLRKTTPCGEPQGVEVFGFSLKKL